MAVNRRFSQQQIADAARPGESQDQVIQRLRREKKVGSGAVIRRSAGDASMQGLLPFWPDHVRAIPNDVARSAIFTVRSYKEKRVAYRDAPVFSVSSNVRLTFTGVELRAADDELVWQQLLHYARSFGPDNWIEFTASQMCRDLGWPQNAAYRQRVRQSILTLAAASILVENTAAQEERGLNVRFVDKFEFETRDGDALPRWRVRLGRELAAWFSDYKFTQLEMAGYRELTPIARRIADYVCSHASPYALQLQTLKEMCGSETQELKRWKFMVKEALELLRHHGFVADFAIEDKLVRITRPGQGSATVGS